MTPAQYQQVLKGLSQSSSGLAGWYKSNPDISGNLSTASNVAGGGANALGTLADIQQGGVKGDVGAAANAAQLAGRTGIFGANTGNVNTGATGALDALAMYQGIQKGGVTGYGQALGAGMQGAGALLGNAALQSAGGYVLAPLAVYNAVNNWQSGKTGSDALNGAEAGAAVGSVVPGVGTIIGGVIGGALGALSSAFGPGAKDPEQDSWGGYFQAYNQANKAGMGSDLTAEVQNPYMPLAGLFDLRSPQITGNIPMYDQYGRMGEQKFTTDMTQQIQNAINKGTITQNDDASSIYRKVIAPWMTSFGKGANTDPNSAAQQGLLTQMVSQYMGGQAQQDWRDINGGTPFANLAGPKWTTAPLAAAKSTLPVNAMTTAAGRNANPLTTAGGTPITVGGSAGSLPPTMGYNPGPQPMMQANEFGLNSIGHSEGGSMKKRKSALDELYRGSFKNRQHFDDGGLAYFSDPSAGVYDTVSGSGQPDFLQYSGTDTTNPNNVAPGYSQQDYGAGPKSGSSGSGTTKTQQQLNNLKANISGDNGITGILNVLKGVAPIAGALLSHSNTNLAKPTAAPGMTYGATNPRAPIFTRTQNMAPSNKPGGAPMSLQDWYTYGSRPETSFFNNNSVPLAQATGVAQGQAKGGALSHMGGDGSFGMPEFDSAVQHHVSGPGDGTSDDIPAKLSDGEYVMDANTVSTLGNGSNKAGAQRLDELRANLRKQAAKPMSKGKQFMKAKPPEQYMKGGRKEKKGG